jgi:hypothetical protein
MFDRPKKNIMKINVLILKFGFAFICKQLDSESSMFSLFKCNPLLVTAPEGGGGGVNPCISEIYVDKKSVLQDLNFIKKYLIKLRNKPV